MVSLVQASDEKAGCMPDSWVSEMARDHFTADCKGVTEVGGMCSIQYATEYFAGGSVTCGPAKMYEVIPAVVFNTCDKIPTCGDGYVRRAPAPEACTDMLCRQEQCCEELGTCVEPTCTSSTDNAVLQDLCEERSADETACRDLEPACEWGDEFDCGIGFTLRVAKASTFCATADFTTSECCTCDCYTESYGELSREEWLERFGAVCAPVSGCVCSGSTAAQGAECGMHVHTTGPIEKCTACSSGYEFRYNHPNRVGSGRARRCYRRSPADEDWDDFNWDDFNPRDWG